MSAGMATARIMVMANLPPLCSDSTTEESCKANLLIAELDRPMRRCAPVLPLVLLALLCFLVVNVVRSMQVLSRLTPAFARSESASVVSKAPLMGTLRKIAGFG